MPASPTLILCLALAGVVALVAACTKPPDLDDSVSPALKHADYPDLVPIEQLLGPAPETPDADAETAAALERRLSGLQARATRLQASTGIDQATRERLGEPPVTD